MIARLLWSQEIAPEVRHFEFELPEVQEFRFKPGQFVSISGEWDGKTFTRAYSIASEPDRNRFALCLNRVREGRMSPRLFALQPGETIPCKGPFGSFMLRDAPGEILMVATGTGVAPFRSMIRTYLEKDRERRWTLLLGVRYEHSILYRAEFEELERAHPHFRFLPTLTRPGPDWRGLTGRVQTHVEGLAAGRSDLQVYACGMKAMVNDVRAMLAGAGWDRARIVTEKYDA